MPSVPWPAREPSTASAWPPATPDGSILRRSSTGAPCARSDVRTRRPRLLAATLFHNLGGLEHARGRFARAERWSRRGLALRTRGCGAASAETAIDVAALAAIVHARGGHEEAARLYRRSLAVLRRRLGPNHFEVVFNLGQLAALEHTRGRFLSSGRLYGRALPALERLLGRAHPVVAQVAENRRKLRAAVSPAEASRARPRTGLRRAG